MGSNSVPFRYNPSNLDPLLGRCVNIVREEIMQFLKFSRHSEKVKSS